MFPDASWPYVEKRRKHEMKRWIAPMYQMAGPKRGFTEVWLRGLPGAQCSPWKTTRFLFGFSALTRRAHGKAGVYKMMAAMGPYVLLSAWQLRSSPCWHHVKTTLGLRFHEEPAPMPNEKVMPPHQQEHIFNLDVHARHKPSNFEWVWYASLRWSSPSSQSSLKKSTVGAFRNLHVDMMVCDYVS